MTRGARYLAPLVLVGASLVTALFAADWAVRHWALNDQPMRSRANHDRVLSRPEFSARVVTNALGFRERRLPGPKPAGTVRIVALGDSFTQGYGVEDAAAFPQRLETLLRARDPARHYEVVNLGVPGASPPDYLYHLREVGMAYHPDLVLMGVMANDANDIYVRHLRHPSALDVVHELQGERLDHRPAWKRLPSRLWPALYDFVGERARVLKARLLEAGASPAAEEPATPAPAPPAETVPPSEWRGELLSVADHFGRRAEVEAALASQGDALLARLGPVLEGGWSFEAPDWAPYMALMGLMQPHVYADAVLLPPAYDAAWEALTAYLGEINRVARGGGARTIILFIPAVYQVTPEGWRYMESYGVVADPRTLTDRTFADRLKAFGASAGIPVVDLLPILRAQARRPLYYYLEDGHWTPEAHALAAEALADMLLSRPELRIDDISLR